MSPVPRTRQPKSETWNDRLSASIGATVARLRNERELSVRQVSEALAKIGHPIGRPALSQLELGQRTASLADLLALAEAFGVPPAALVAPLDAPDAVEMLPSQPTIPWEAFKRFVDTPESTWGAKTEQGARIDRIASLYRSIESAVSMWKGWRMSRERIRQEAAKDSTAVIWADQEGNDGTLQRYVREAAASVDELQALGLPLPELPHEFLGALKGGES